MWELVGCGTDVCRRQACRCCAVLWTAAGMELDRDGAEGGKGVSEVM